MSKKTEITLTNESGTYTVSVPYTELTLNEVGTALLIRVLLAAGYSPDSVRELITSDEDAYPSLRQ